MISIADYMFRTQLIFVLYICHTGSESNVVPFYGLTQVAGCLCSGETITYQCSVPAGIATVWRGSAFNCPSISNAVVLHHSQYTSDNSSGECSGHDIRGQGISAANSTYVSILNVTVNSNYSYYQNKMIECVYSDGSQLIPIGRIMINASLPTGNTDHFVSLFYSPTCLQNQFSLLLMYTYLTSPQCS